MPSPIRAVIFDMDGVLIDSEPVYLGMQARNLQTKYPWVTLESMYPTVGMSSQEYPRFMARLCRVPFTPEFEKELMQADENEPIHFPDILRPEARPMLEQLRAMGLQLALASSSPMSNIRQVLGECGLMEFFPVIVSGEQFEASKPDPEIYLHTMARLGRRPEECLIVEDSTYGVQAGAAAGGLVAALRDERFPFDQSAARFHIGNLSEIPALAASIQYNLAAGFLYALSICYFARGSDFAPGGVSGLALIVNYLWHLPVGITTLVFNLPLVALSIRFVGRAFLAKSLVSMVWCTVFQDVVFARVGCYTGDPLVAALFAGVTWGFALALLYMRGSSSGGTDFLTMSIKVLRPHLSIGGH